MKKYILVIMIVLSVCGCSYSNLDYVKSNAKQTWENVGYEIIGYEGFQWGFTFPFWWSYGGAQVWYSLKRGNNGIIYTGFLQRWGNEIHVYGTKSIDAIKP